MGKLHPVGGYVRPLGNSGQPSLYFQSLAIPIAKLIRVPLSQGGFSPWQQVAIDRMIPLLKELASNTTAAINHLSENKLRPTSGQYTEYLRANADTAHQLSDMISSVVPYGQTQAKLDKLEQKLEVAAK